MNAAGLPLNQDFQTAPHNAGRPFCLACSPRKDGNSDFAARRLAGIFNEVTGRALVSVPGAKVQPHWPATSPPAGSSPAASASPVSPASTDAPDAPEPPNPPNSMELLYLREHPVAACVSCGACERPGQAPCGLDGRRIVGGFDPAVSRAASGAPSRVKTGAETGTGTCAGPGIDDGAGTGMKDSGPELFDRLFSAPTLLIASPVYFYHVPALFKAFIDRGQYWWMRKLQGHPRFNGLREKRPAHVLLLCGRPRGERLFEGSLLSLKFFLSIFGFELREPLLLRGLDGAQDLSGNAGALSALDAWGASLAAAHETQIR